MKINKTIIISDILSIVLAFSLFILIFLEMKNVAIVYDRLISNLFIKTFNPIQRITLNRNDCQEKNAFSLFNYTFPGINDFCYDNEKIVECDAKNKSIIKNNKINSKNFTIWRNKLICSQYFDYDTTSYKLIKSSDECGNGFETCGTLNNDASNISLHKLLCVKKNIECPINFIKITNDISKYKKTEYQILQFENGYYLVTGRKISSNGQPLGIITKIEIAEGKYPCIEKGRYSYSTPPFPKINNIDKFGCPKIDEVVDPLINEGYDSRYKILDTINKSEVLAENDLDYSYGHLPNLINWTQDINTSHFNLFYQTSFISKDNCEKFKEPERYIKKLRNLQASRVIFALFHIIIYVLLFSILGLIKVILAWRHSLLFGIKIGLSFVIFIINIIFVFSSEKYAEHCIISDSDSFKVCLDEVSLALLKNFKINDIIDELKNKFYLWEKIIWYCYIFFNVIEAVRLIYKIYVRCKNTYRRNIAHLEIGTENLMRIFEKVRNELEKKKNE